MDAADWPTRDATDVAGPHRVAKLSGIGCLSKTPTYFLGNSHGFNRVHGRMRSVLTGANLAEHNEAVNRLDFMPIHSEITTEYAPGSVQEVMQIQRDAPLGTTVGRRRRTRRPAAS